MSAEPERRTVADTAQQILGTPRPPSGSDDDIKRVVVATFLGERNGLRPMAFIDSAYQELVADMDRRVLAQQRRWRDTASKTDDGAASATVSVADMAQALLELPRAPAGTDEEIQRAVVAAFLGDEAGLRPAAYVQAAFAELAKVEDQRVMQVGRRMLEEEARRAPPSSDGVH